MSKHNLAVSLICCALAPHLFADSWTLVQPVPTPRSALFAEAIGGLIYAGRGASPGGTTNGRFDSYDPIVNVWTQRSSPSGDYGRGHAVVGGKIYTFGGVGGSSADVFDPFTNAWSTLPSMPSARPHPKAAAVNGIIYVLGGHGSSSSANEAYTPSTNTWIGRAPMPRPRSNHSVTAAGTKIYVFGGSDVSGAYLDIVDVYDTVNNTWATLTTRMPRPCIGAGAVVLNGRILLIGGDNPTLGTLRTVEEYDPVMDRWRSRASMNVARNFLGATVRNGLVYAIAGENATGYLDTVEVYDPLQDPTVSSDAWTFRQALPTSRSSLIAETVGRLIYAGRGASPGGTTNGRFDTYDAIANAWTQRPSPSSDYGRGHAVVNGKIYTFGGVGGSSTDVFDPATNAWSSLASIPSTRPGPKAAAVNGIIYVLGGHGSSSSANEAYDPATNTWSARQPMPRPRHNHAVTALGSKIYVFGGSDVPGAYLDVIDVYETTANSWTTLLTRMPRPCIGPSAVVLNGRILLIGGHNPTLGPLRTADEYDPATDRWLPRAPMNIPRNLLGATVLDGLVYAIGGENTAYLTDVEVYDASKDSLLPAGPGTISVSTNAPGATFTIAGPQNFSGGGTSYSTLASPGTYTIQFNDIGGYVTPPSQTNTLAPGGTIAFGGSYQQLCTYSVTPSPASLNWSGGTVPFSVTTSLPGCEWRAFWVESISDATIDTSLKTGSGEVSVWVPQSGERLNRRGVLNIAGHIVTIEQGTSITTYDRRLYCGWRNSPNEGPIECNSTLLRPDRPTVVLTHGLQPTDEQVRNLWSGWAADQLAGKLIESTFPNINVVQFVWLGAFQGSPLQYEKARFYAPDAATWLSRELIARLNSVSPYQQRIHFVGHSLGSVVSTYAAAQFLDRTSMVKEAQLTVLDRPHRVPGLVGQGYNENFIPAVLPLRRPGLTLKVDNYFACTGLGVGDISNGDVYNHGELVDPGRLFSIFEPLSIPNDHTGVHQWYRWTIDPRASYPHGTPVCNGEKPDPTVEELPNPCAKGWFWSIVNGNTWPTTASTTVGCSGQTAQRFNQGQPLGLPVSAEIITPGCTLPAAGNSITGSTTAECVESSSPYMRLNAAIPANAAFLSFKFRLGSVGDGDAAVVLVDNTPLWMVGGGSAPAGQLLDSGRIPLDGLTGARKLTIALHGRGQPNFSFQIQDVVTHAVSNVAGDLNASGKVDCADVAIVRASFGRRPGQIGFDSRADTNWDGIVDIRDLSYVAQKLPAGTTCP